MFSNNINLFNKLFFLSIQKIEEVINAIISVIFNNYFTDY